MRRLIERLLARHFNTNDLANKLQLIEHNVSSMLTGSMQPKGNMRTKTALNNTPTLKGIQFRFYGISSPLIQDAFTRTYDKEQSFEINYALFEPLVKSDMFEHKLYAFRILEKTRKHFSN